MVQWILNNYLNVLAAIGTLFLAAKAVVALTPSVKDDEIVAQAEGWFNKIFGFLAKK